MSDIKVKKKRIEFGFRTYFRAESRAEYYTILLLSEEIRNYYYTEMRYRRRDFFDEIFSHVRRIDTHDMQFKGHVRAQACATKAGSS